MRLIYLYGEECRRRSESGFKSVNKLEPRVTPPVSSQTGGTGRCIAVATSWEDGDEVMQADTEMPYFEDGCNSL